MDARPHRRWGCELEAPRQGLLYTLPRDKGYQAMTDLEKLIGKRCKTKDTHDFPDLAHDERCGACEMWEAVDKEINSARIDELEWVDSQLVAIPCEEDCNPERHAHHQGSWDMCREIEIDLEFRIEALKRKGK